MTRGTRKLADAEWTSYAAGVVSLARDWRDHKPPPIYWSGDKQPLQELRPAPAILYAKQSGYYIRHGWITFLVQPNHFPNRDWDAAGLYLAGSFNGWGLAQGQKAWELKPARFGGECHYLLTVPKDKCLAPSPACFKFINGNGEWLEVPTDAPNAVLDARGNRNYTLDLRRTGKNIFYFTAPTAPDHSGPSHLIWAENGYEEIIEITPGPFLLDLKSDLPLGAQILDGKTVFRLFAPRACAVTVNYYKSLLDPRPRRLRLRRTCADVWEASAPANLDGYLYHYHVASEAADSHASFDPAFKILDPYARAALGPAGPGIIISPDKFPPVEDPFQPPARENLVIAETHVRDLAAKAPVPLADNERLGFTGLRKWAESGEFYLSRLGVNAVEIQPVAEFDAPKPETYHWGYMPVNFFSPASHYALNPSQASQIEEFRSLVQAFHRRGIAVILDTVYNHAGEPNHLNYIDKHYYFDLSPDGHHMNWSGCGNTLRCGAPMVKRLIIESLEHWVRAYDVDGFRFDLAEILGLDVLIEIETALKKIKPSVILIAEPWSFRGHIAHVLRKTGYSYWNDGYRDFLRQYILGRGNQEGLRYFLAGSTAFLTRQPAQSVNYVESHDDYCWIDRITENPGRDGSAPSPKDIRRTRLMAAILFCSLGLPMISAGQDMLRSKKGVRNTYQQGDLNALDYRRLETYRSTHEYFRAWIRFRLSEQARALRLRHSPPEGYLRFFGARDSSAGALLVNASRSAPCPRIFFAVNPHGEKTVIPMDGFAMNGFLKLADEERFFPQPQKTLPCLANKNALLLPPFTCSLWTEGNPS